MGVVGVRDSGRNDADTNVEIKMEKIWGFDAVWYNEGKELFLWQQILQRFS